jgi:glutathione S-transferase
MRRVWGRANSSNVMKVLWLLDELGLPYERIDAGGQWRNVDAPAYRAINPTGTVPTLEEGAFTVFESNVILRYLASVHAAGSPLWPLLPQARANTDRWMDWQQCALNPPATAIFLGLVRTPPEKRDAAAIEKATVDATRHYTLLDAQMAKGGYITGSEFSLADIPIGPNVHRWFNLDIRRPSLPHLRAWYDRMLARPAFARHVAQPLS